MTGALEEKVDEKRHAYHNERSFRAWTCVAGAFLWMTVSQGIFLVHGLLLVEIDTHFGRDIRHPWLSGMASCAAMVTSPFFGIIMDTYGPILLAILAVACTVGVFLTLSLCTTFSHLVAVFLWHGVTCGVCIAVGPSMAGKLFEKGGLAQGITMCGSSLAGVIYAAVFSTLYKDWHTGNQILAIATGAVSVLALATTFLFDSVLPDDCKEQSFKPASLVSVSKLLRKDTWSRNAAYAWFLGGSFFLQFAIFGASATIPFIAESIGASKHGQHCLIALSGASIFGRLISGWLGDTVGHFMTLFWTCLAEVIILVANVFLADKGVLPLYFASATWGFFSGCWVPLFAACVGKLCEPREFGKYYGISNLIISPSSLLAAPLMRYVVERFSAGVLYGVIAGIVTIGAGMVWVSRRYRRI